jgi:hypothetical protein
MDTPNEVELQGIIQSFTEPTMGNPGSLFKVSVRERMLLLDRIAVLVHPAESFSQHVADQANAVDGGVGDDDGEELLWAIENVRAEFREAPELRFRSNDRAKKPWISIGRIRHSSKLCSGCWTAELVCPSAGHTRGRSG